MTFRYCQLAVGRYLPTKRGIDWREVSADAFLAEFGDCVEEA